MWFNFIQNVLEIQCIYSLAFSMEHCCCFFIGKRYILNLWYDNRTVPYGIAYAIFHFFYCDKFPTQSTLPQYNTLNMTFNFQCDK